MKNTVYHFASKYIEATYNFVWECVMKRKLSLEKIFMSNNISNDMRKNLSTDLFYTLQMHMGLGLILT